MRSARTRAKNRTTGNARTSAPGRTPPCRARSTSTITVGVEKVHVLLVQKPGFAADHNDIRGKYTVPSVACESAYQAAADHIGPPGQMVAKMASRIARNQAVLKSGASHCEHLALIKLALGLSRVSIARYSSAVSRGFGRVDIVISFYPAGRANFASGPDPAYGNPRSHRLQLSFPHSFKHLQI